MTNTSCAPSLPVFAVTTMPSTMDKHLRWRCAGAATQVRASCLSTSRVRSLDAALVCWPSTRPSLFQPAPCGDVDEPLCVDVDQLAGPGHLLAVARLDSHPVGVLPGLDYPNVNKYASVPGSRNNFQKFTRTTRLHSSAWMTGSELSHSPPPSEGMCRRDTVT
jgi:hypothetical protein